MTATLDPATLKTVVSQFAILGEFLGAQPYGTGHINDTFAAVFDQGGTRVRYILQRINHRIFKEPVKLVENIAHVTNHLRAKLEGTGTPDAARRVLTLVQARDGANHHTDAEGRVWRCYIFVEGARSFDIIETASQAFQASKTFGTFQRLLMDYAGPRLYETIPRFHHTRSRFERLEQAIAQDVCNRARLVKAEITFAHSREPLVDCLRALTERGEVPERITHNDTKLNNVLLDDITGEGMCVLDLDTVMPGLSLYDFGDMVRTVTNPVAEDEQDLSLVQVQVPMFEAIAHGYLEGTAGTLLPAERDRLVAAGKMLTYECGLRFLTDFLEGDHYFHTQRAEHNLDRCRTQFALVRSLEAHEEHLEGFIRSLRDR